MGIPSVTASRIYKGQLKGKTGEEEKLNFEDFPYSGLVKTYNTDAQTSDSAGTATAYLCGVKTKKGVIGIDDRVTRGICSTGAGGNVDSIVRRAQYAGKATGIVTTTRVTHATPAATYAHSPDRTWETNRPMPLSEKRDGCQDIATQLAANTDLNVVLGGGRATFLSLLHEDPEFPKLRGLRTDGKNLVNTWLNNHGDAGHTNFHYVWNQTQFDAVDPATTNYLLGLFQPSHMQFAALRKNDSAGEPSLEEMTEKAIQIMQNDPDGFVLVVESGRIDHGHHMGSAQYALEEVLALDRAVKKATDMVDLSETLVIVTADHSHTMVLQGYSTRGNPILGFANAKTPLDKLPYTSIGYLNGPGAVRTAAEKSLEMVQAPASNKTFQAIRPDDSNWNTESKLYFQQALIPMESETHGGEDVPVYAVGPMAHLFHTTHEQSYLAHAMQYAACIGDYAGACDRTTVPSVLVVNHAMDHSNGGSTLVNSMLVLTIMLALAIIHIEH
ncbi:alkaline phosphatase-like isoform X2 [Apostichopus japonicus]